MADEAVLRIVLDDSGSPTAAPGTTAPIPPSPSPKSTSTTTQPKSTPPPPPPIDPAMFGHSYTATAKNLLRPMQFLDDRKKEQEFLAKLLSHPGLQSGGLQTEIRRLGESRLAEFSSLRKALGKPDAPDVATGIPPPPAPASVPVPSPAIDPHEERRLLNEERMRKRNAAPPPAVPPPAAPPDPKDPVPVKLVESPKPVPPPAAPPLDPGLGRRPDEPRPAELDDPSEYSPRTRARMERDRAGAAGRRPDEPRPAELDDPSQYSPRTRDRMERERLAAAGGAAPPPSPPPYQPPPPPPYQPPAPQEQDQDAVGQHTYTGLPNSRLYQKRKREGEGVLPPPPSQPPPSPSPPLIEPVKSGFDALLDVVVSMRGTIGGLFGTLAGATIDVVKGVRKAQVQKDKDDKHRQLLKETELANAPEAVPLQPGETLADAPLAEVVPAVSSLGDAASSVGAKMAVMVPVVAAATVAFGAVTAALDTAVKRYGEYSPDIAQAEAMVEVRQVMNDLRRSQEYGPELAKYVESQARMQEKFEEAKMKLLMKLAPTIEGMYEIMGGLMEAFGSVSSLLEVSFAPLAALGTIASSIGEIVGMQRDDRFEDAKDPTSVLLESIPYVNGDANGVQVPTL